MAVIVNDTFTESVDTALTAHVPDTGTSWVEEERTGVQIQTVVAAGDRCAAASNEASDRHIYTSRPNPTSAEYDVVAELNGVVSASGTDRVWWLIARLTDTSNYYGTGVYPASNTNDCKI